MINNRIFNVYRICRLIVQPVCWVLTISIMVLSCSSPTQVTHSSPEKDNAEVIEEDVVPTQFMDEFNMLLGDIKDKESSTKAVTNFVEYMAEKFKEPEGGF